MQYQIFHRKPFYTKFFYFNREVDENYGYRWFDCVLTIGSLQIRWRSKPKKIV
jgi:hypothetical protein